MTDMEKDEIPLKTVLTGESNDIIYDFDAVLKYIGNMGRYQALVASFALYVTLPVSMHEIGAVFLLGVPLHRYVTYPGCYDGCKMYNNNNYTSTCCDNNTDCAALGSNMTIPCEDYIYSEDVFGKTVVSEWDLVCDRSILGTTSNAIFFAGCFVGAIAGGNLSDNFGRLLALFVANILALISGIACAFTPTLALFTAARFIVATTMAVTYSTGLVYVMEILGGKWRLVMATVHGGVFATGYPILSLLAYIWKDWRDLQLAMSLVSAPFVFMWALMPESPRWLFAKRKNSKGRAVSILIARRNGSIIPIDAWSKSLSGEETVSNKKYYSTLTLFRLRGIRRMTLIFMICFFAASLTYFGLSLNIGSLSGDIYINNALSGLTEMISIPFVLLIIRRYGRRTSTSASFVFAGIMCITASIVNNAMRDLGVIATCLALCGKLSISMTYTILFVYISELYPTVVRATSVSIGSASGLVASICTPYTLYLQYYASWLPGIVFGVASLLAGFASMGLKETRRRKLMTTLAEAEAFYRS